MSDMASPYKELAFVFNTDLSSASEIFDSKASFLKKILFIYLFLAALGLRCCAWAFSSCVEQRLLFVEVCGLLIAVASLVAEHRF